MHLRCLEYGSSNQVVGSSNLSGRTKKTCSGSMSWRLEVFQRLSKIERLENSQIFAEVYKSRGKSKKSTLTKNIQRRICRILQRHFLCGSFAGLRSCSRSISVGHWSKPAAWVTSSPSYRRTSLGCATICCATSGDKQRQAG